MKFNPDAYNAFYASMLTGVGYRVAFEDALAGIPDPEPGPFQLTAEEEEAADLLVKWGGANAVVVRALDRAKRTRAIIGETSDPKMIEKAAMRAAYPNRCLNDVHSSKQVCK